MSDARELNDLRKAVRDLRDLMAQLLMEDAEALVEGDKRIKTYDRAREKVRSHFRSVNEIPHFLRYDRLPRVYEDILRIGRSEAFEVYLYPLRQLLSDLPRLWKARYDPVVVPPETPGVPKQGSRPEPIASSIWTGRTTVRQRVVAIRAYAPIVLDALDQIIELNERAIHNQVPEPAQLAVIQQLRQLHHDLGELLLAVDEGRLPKAALAQIAKVTRRLFCFSADTRELLMGGLPVLGATAIYTLAAIKGLEVCGIDLDSTGDAAIIAGSAAIMAGERAARRTRRR